jgi:hypothetical protein
MECCSSCNGTIPLLFYFNMAICLYKQGFIDLSLILQAVKCHAASRARKTDANPPAAYAIPWILY